MKIKNRNTKGFTLIELMFVAFLFLLVAGFSAARFSRSFRAADCDLAKRDLLARLNNAHERAIMERAEYVVHVPPSDTPVRFYPDGTADAAVLRFSGDGHPWSVIINPVSGKGTIHEEEL